MAGRAQFVDLDLVELARLGADTGGDTRFGEGQRGVFGVAHVGAVPDDQRELGLDGQRLLPRSAHHTTRRKLGRPYLVGARDGGVPSTGVTT